MSLALSSANLAPYASGERILAQAFNAAFRPRPPANVADFAAANRWLSNEGGGYVGRWDHALAPYLIGPMEALSGDYLTVAVAGPGQCGKTEIARNFLFASALADPADMLWYSASEPLVTTEAKGPILRMVNDHKELKALLSDNSIFFKRFGGMSVQFLAGVMGNMISKSAPRIVADEWDKICQSIPNAKEVLDLRRQTFGVRSKMLCLSHPDNADDLEEGGWNGGIMELFRDSTRCLWYWQCPHCGVYSSPNPAAARVMTIHYDEAAPDDEIRAMARLACPVHGCLIEDGARHAMNLTGKWVGLGQSIDEDGTVHGELIKRDTAGFWITGAMSPFALGGIGGLAVARARAERKFLRDNDRQALREVVSKQWGMPLPKARRQDSIDANTLAERAEDNLKLGQVAHGVRFITVMIDVQGNRFELLARGWCEGGRSVIVDFRSIPASPGTSEEDWDDVLKLATETLWPLEGQPGRGLRAHLTGFDSQGVPGVATQAMAAWKRLRAARKARLLGRINGLPVWNIIPTKGAATPAAPRLQVVYPESNRKDRRSGAMGEVPLALFNPNLFKDDLNDQLCQAPDARWAIRFPKALAAPLPPHPWFEQLVAEERDQRDGPG
ncbi:terminase gpA endonuclease subunit [Acidocella sp.]|uniref:terminase gpA endonuclease subunit n=1 Tax=Acidocella sp. TaxID=50710 RepID=UPI0026126813|nr:terminase gpA endonuclease subunit [Acidocella sp.]